MRTLSNSNHVTGTCYERASHNGATDRDLERGRHNDDTDEHSYTLVTHTHNSSLGLHEKCKGVLKGRGAGAMAPDGPMATCTGFVLSSG